MKRLVLLVISLLACFGFSHAQNVGVDVAAPEQKLDVAGGLKIGNTSNDVAGSIRWNGTNFQVHDGTEWITFGTGTDDDWSISNDDIYSAVSGNVGIGTQFPFAKLHVAGVVRVGQLSVNGNYLLPVGDGLSGQVLTTNGAGQVTWTPAGTGDISSVIAGNGLITGGTSGDVTLDVNAGDGIVLSGDEVQVQASDLDGDGLTVTSNNFDINVDNSTLETNADALRVKTSGITSNEIATGAVTTAEILDATILPADLSAGNDDQVLTSSGGTVSWSDQSTTTSDVEDSDSDTKIEVEQSADEDVIRMSTAGSERITVLSNGNVGIGTTAPAKPLEVVGAVRLATLAGSDTRILTTDANGDLSAVSFASTAMAANGMSVDVAGNAIELGGPLTEDTEITHGTYNFTHDLNSSGDFHVKAQGSNRFTVDDLGYTNFGRSTFWKSGSTDAAAPMTAIMWAQTPVGAFSLLKDGVTSIHLHSNGETGFNMQGLDSDLRIQGQSDQNNFFSDASTDRIGMGTNQPLSKLDVRGDARLEASDGNTLNLFTSDLSTVSGQQIAGIGFNSIDGGSYNDQTQASAAILSFAAEDQSASSRGAYLSFRTKANGSGVNDNNVERMRVSEGGNIGIGISTPSQMLDISGAIKLGTTSNNTAGSIRWNGSNFQGHNGSTWVDLDDSGEAATATNGLDIDPSGDVKLGGTLTESTTINMATNPLTFNVTNAAGSFFVSATGTNRFKVSNSGQIFMAHNTYWKYGDTDGATIKAQMAVENDGAWMSVLGSSGGSITLRGNGETLFNQSNQDNDFRIAGQSEYANFFADASTDRIGLGTSTPATKLHVVGNGRFTALSGSGNQAVMVDNDGDFYTTAPAGDDNLGDHTATTDLAMASQNITGVDKITTLAESDYDKIQLYDANNTIGMYSSSSFGSVTDWAMTFTVEDQMDRGFIWRGHTDLPADAAMSLSTDGHLTVRERIYVGEDNGSLADIYLADNIMDWDNTVYRIDPDEYSRMDEIMFDNGSATDPSINFQADPNTGIFQPANNHIGMSLNGTERIRITNLGYLGINQSSPDADLHIKQSSSADPDPTSGGIILESSGNTNQWQIWSSDPFLSFAYNGTRKAYVHSTSGAWTVTSDRRFKKDIESMEPVLDKVVALNPVKYRYKDNKNDVTKTRGFIAQEVRAIFPDLVYTEKGGQLAISPGDFGILAIKAVQEQQAVIEEQRARIAEQDQQIQTQQAQYNALLQRVQRLENQPSKQR